MLCGCQGNKIIEVSTFANSHVDIQHVSLPVTGQPEAGKLEPSFLETRNVFSLWGVHTLAGFWGVLFCLFLSFFLFFFTGHNPSFPRKSILPWVPL